MMEENCVSLCIKYFKMKSHFFDEIIVTISGYSFLTQKRLGILEGDGIVLCLDCAGGHTAIYVC